MAPEKSGSISNRALKCGLLVREVTQSQVTERQIGPEEWQVRQVLRCLESDLQSLVDPLHLEQLVSDGGPGVPGVRSCLECLLKPGKQLVGPEGVGGQPAERHQSVSRAVVAGELAPHEGKRLPPVLGGAEMGEEISHRGVAVARHVDGPTVVLLRFLALARKDRIRRQPEVMPVH